MTARSSAAPIAVLNEHPEWQKRLYAELSRRGLAYDEIAIHDTGFDPSRRETPYRLVVNRTSPSSANRGHASAVFFAQSALAFYEATGARVVNGTEAYRLETSKALQMILLAKLGLRYPRTRVVNSADAVRRAARELAFPLMVKPNIGGSGAGIQKFDALDALEAWLATGTPAFGLDGTALVQEFHPARDGHIVRVEMLGERHLYSVRIYPDTTDFNLCPADICQVRPGEPVAETAAKPASGGNEFEVCAVTAPTKGLRIERHEEAPEVVAAARKVASAAHLDVCGIEYLVSARDGERYFYDVNALSNFVRDAEQVVGFDPTAVFVDYLQTLLT